MTRGSASSASRRSSRRMDSAFDPASIGLITGAKGGLPTIVVGGFESLGAPTNEPRGRVSQAYQVVDALVWTRGSHTLKAGVDYRRPLVRSYNDQFSRGRLSFNNLADLLAGVAAPSGTSIARGATRRDTYTNNLGLFLQDDWKINSRLTLNLGLRHEYTGPLSEKYDRISNFLPATGLVRVGQGLDTLYDRDWNNFAPRVGFAFDPRGTGKTVLRGSLRLLLRRAFAGFLPGAELSQWKRRHQPGARPRDLHRQFHRSGAVRARRGYFRRCQLSQFRHSPSSAWINICGHPMSRVTTSTCSRP